MKTHLVLTFIVAVIGLLTGYFWREVDESNRLLYPFRRSASENLYPVKVVLHEDRADMNVSILPFNQGKHDKRFLLCLVIKTKDPDLVSRLKKRPKVAAVTFEAYDEEGVILGQRLFTQAIESVNFEGGVLMVSEVTEPWGRRLYERLQTDLGGMRMMSELLGID